MIASYSAGAAQSTNGTGLPFSITEMPFLMASCEGTGSLAAPRAVSRSGGEKDGMLPLVRSVSADFWLEMKLMYSAARSWCFECVGIVHGMSPAATAFGPSPDTEGKTTMWKFLVASGVPGMGISHDPPSENRPSPFANLPKTSSVLYAVQCGVK